MRLLATLIATVEPAGASAIAERLYARFGSLAAILAADCGALGLGGGTPARVQTLLSACRAVLFHALREQVQARPILASQDDLRDYLILTLGNLPTEEFHVLFLANGYRLICDERMWHGTVDKVPAYPREIVRRALHLGAKSLIIVHNHPSGDLRPSAMDEASTSAICRACRAMEIDLLDHIIVTRSGTASFRDLKLL